MVQLGLENKVVIVTGATSGIGLALAEAYLAEGSTVYVTGLEQDECERISKELQSLPGQAIPLQLDITNKRDIGAVLQHVVEHYGRIDVIINNAAIVGRKATFDIDEEFFDLMFNVNVKGTFFFTQAVAKIMVKQKYGKIINISSASGKLIRKGLANPIYSMNKAAINLMTKTLAEDLAKNNINVNAIAPGYIITGPVLERFQNEDFFKGVTDSTPIQRVGDVSDLKGIALFLGSDLSSYITGQIIYIDGGRTVL